MPRPAIPFTDRFFQNLKIEGDCVVWTAAKNKEGYGVIGIGDRKTALAHRVSWFIAKGVWPAGQLMHSCDNPACVRIKHLSEGTQLQNMRDKVEKNRQIWGEDIATGKLTEEQVREIRRLGTTRVSSQEIAKQFGVTKSAINCAIRRRSWKLLDPAPPPPHRTSRPNARRFEVEGELLTVVELARRAGVTEGAVTNRINRGLTGHDLIAGKHRGKRKEYRRT